jgi:hypothetical protein
MGKKAYVIHFCKNKECNNAWIDLDLTNAQTRPPSWKYCKECCEKLGINFDKQEPPKKVLSKKQIETLEKNKFTKRKKSK